jgi:hypothetical protein
MGPFDMMIPMGYRLLITSESKSGPWSLTMTVNLTRTESNALFLSGDSMVSWPVGGLEEAENAGLKRSGMFISEMAARLEGLSLRYATRAQAEQAAGLLRAQLTSAGIKEEC